MAYRKKKTATRAGTRLFSSIHSIAHLKQKINPNITRRCFSQKI